MTDTLEVVAVLLAGGALLGLVGWFTPLPRLTTALTALLLGSAAALTVLYPAGQATEPQLATVVTAGALLALVAGGPLTTVVFDLVDQPGRPGEGPVQRAGEVLRGGAWIGALERLAAYAAVATGWPEGLAVVLAVKGLGRYPELKAPAEGAPDSQHRAAAERFIIGTFTSVLWALACAGAVRLAVG